MLVSVWVRNIGASMIFSSHPQTLRYNSEIPEDLDLSPSMDVIWQLPMIQFIRTSQSCSVRIHIPKTPSPTTSAIDHAGCRVPTSANNTKKHIRRLSCHPFTTDCSISPVEVLERTIQSAKSPCFQNSVQRKQICTKKIFTNFSFIFWSSYASSAIPYHH